MTDRQCDADAFGRVLALIGRTVGFTALQGGTFRGGGLYTITGPPMERMGRATTVIFSAAPVSGDFTLTARSRRCRARHPRRRRLMVRENIGRRARWCFWAACPGPLPQLTYRTTTTTSANADGIDFTIGRRVLTFPTGVTTQNIPFTIQDDARAGGGRAGDDRLAQSTGARLGSTQFTCIVDDDAPPALPFVGFASAERQRG